MDKETQYLKEVLNEEFFELQIKNGLPDVDQCPLHQWVMYNKTTCANEVVSGTTTCPLCNHPMCPDCSNHHVDQISRVTGYMSNVSGWGAAKAQEFKDRNRYNNL